MDWNALKTEYITDESASYRGLSKKYDVSFSTLSKRATAEGWKELRRKHRENTVTKTVAKLENKQAGRLAKLMDVSDKLLFKIEEAVDRFVAEEVLVDKQSLKQLTGALKDIKDIQSLKSDLDIREQEARIANLQKQGQDEQAKEIKVVFDGGDPSWKE